MMDNITLIIPTHNRHPLLKRILDYYSDASFPIYVYDSSAAPFSHASRHKLLYRHCPEFQLHQKFEDLAGKIETKYTCLCADDDFISPYAISKCTEFLEANPDYASAQGHYLSFNDVSGNLIFTPRYLSSVGRDVNSDSPSERLRQLFGDYMQLFYCVFRTETFRDIFTLSANRVRQYILLEMFMAAVAVINGKHRVLPVLHGFRAKTAKADAPDLDEMDVLSTSDKHREQYQNYLNILTRHLAEREQIAPSQAHAALGESARIYIDWMYKRRQTREKFSFSNSSSKKTLKNMASGIPFIGKSLVNGYDQYIGARKLQKSLFNSVKHIPGFPYSDPDSTREFRKVVLCIEKHKVQKVQA